MSKKIESGATPREEKELDWPPTEEFKDLEGRAAREALLKSEGIMITGRAAQLKAELEKAVVSGNFTDAKRIIEMLSESVKKLEENFEQHWKDLGPDTEDPIEAMNQYLNDWRSGKIK